MKKEKILTTEPGEANPFLDSLKKEIWESFVEYRSDLSSQKPLGRLAAHFAIPIDTTRLEDYYVRSLNPATLTISIVDKKTDTIYRADYTTHTTFIPSGLSRGLYLEVFSNKGIVRTQNLYRVSKEEKTRLLPVTGELIFTHGDRALIFEKCHNESEDSSIDKASFAISLEVREPNYDAIGKRLPLYKKAIASSACRARGGLREETSLSMTNRVTWQRINVPETKTLYYMIDRVDEHSHLFGYIRDMSKSRHPENSSKKHLIHIIEQGEETCPSFKYFNRIDVYKKVDVLQVKCDFDGVPFEFELCNVIKGPLTPLELGNLISILSHHTDRYFIRKVLIELQEYGRKLCLHRGFDATPEDLLAPSQFAAMSASEIEEIVLSDIDEYFAYAEREYEKSKERLSGQKPAHSQKMKPLN